ncbi:OLC1v1029037C2 [Oldenlandia corymbosa var. corymbosa]|uniref:OLC1v1029037C2 n=1 Tax=Oldenlandia corymbosa var. corymbosa TaxID=529605 RepID=A0AAV1CD52_OLDCO|nr:OLC1v1029037C2 [Oldenlandia corymbosa var. corymbosa]
MICSCNALPICSSSSPARRPFLPHKYDVSTTGTSSTSFPTKPILRKLENILNDIPGTIKKTTIKLLDSFVDSAFDFIDQPLLPSQRNFGPVEELKEAVHLAEVEGKIPDDFPEGVYVRNGPNPLFGGHKTAVSVFGKSSNTWIEGEGMIHALYFNKGTQNSVHNWKVRYKNKYMESETFKNEVERATPAFLPAVEGDSLAVFSALLLNLLRFGTADKYISNTNVFEHGGRFFATAENHAPHEIDISTLETIGKWDLDGNWKRPFTSHPKKVPSTGELVMFGVSAVKPYYQVGVISADGEKIVHNVDIKINRCTLCHDIGITERYNIILDFPLTIDINRLVNGGPLIRYDEKGYARIGVMPRYGDADSLKWFYVEPCTAFHVINCFEDGDEVVVMVCKARGSIIPGPESGLNKLDWFSRGFKHINSVDETSQDRDSQEGAFFARVYEWRLNIQSREAKGKYLTGTDFSMDFPFINEKFTGTRNQYGYTQLVDSEASSISGMAKYGGLAKLHFQGRKAEVSPSEGEAAHRQEVIKVEYHKFPKDTFCTGATFVPKCGGVEEDDGWIITYAHNERTNISQASF